jgi:3-phosphoshikimate 1-carboxyvinyltransferase
MKGVLHGSVNLPGSKSESNRALMIAAYGGFPLQVECLSEAHDTVLLQQLLAKIEKAETGLPCEIDCEDAGTVARFLLTYLACRDGVWVMTGTERMRQRPMKPLIDALRQLGADIVCLNREGFLPLKVKGRSLAGGTAEIDISQSSQFVSSLILAAPSWEHGLTLTLKGNAVSIPYLEMTLSMMKLFGADACKHDSVITVRPQPYHSIPFRVSTDWSSAASWYEWVALAEEGSVLLKGLRQDGLQGDRKLVELFEPLGVSTVFQDEGAKLVKTALDPDLPSRLDFDIADTPDLFPSLLTTCVALHLPAIFHGTRNLVLKESNRVESMISELSKVYTFINIIDDDFIIIDKSLYKNTQINNHSVCFTTYLDHRVVMALAPLSVKLGEVSFDYPEVVSKSYPNFWTEIETFTN